MESLLISLVLSTALALFVYWKKILTVASVICGWVTSILITLAFSYMGFTLLVVVCLVAYLAGKYKTKERQKIEKGIHEHNDKQRNHIQFLANMSVSGILSILHIITESDIYIIAFVCAISASICDSMASDIGVLSKGQTYNITTLKKQAKGLSGGVSILGLIASLITAIMMAIIYGIFIEFELVPFLVIVVLGFVGSIIDSIIGATIQVKYKCLSCGIVTEKKEHCKKKTMHYQGINGLSNDIVNLLTNILVASIAIIIISTI